MTPDPRKILACLFAIPQERIDKELVDAPERLEEIITDVRANIGGADEGKTPERIAENLHKQMLQGYAFQRRPDIQEDFALFVAVFGVQQVAEHAADVAFSEGRLKELGEEMKAVCVREGVGGEEFFPLGEGPEDYQALQNESEKLYERIRDTVMLHMMRRYDLQRIADLFENDRATFEVMMEVGRRMIFHKENTGDSFIAFANERIRKDFGPSALSLLNARLKAAGLRP